MFICSQCDTQFSKWQGRCSECGKWGTVSEQPTSSIQSIRGGAAKPAALVFLSSASSICHDRLQTGILEFDSVMGGGIVQGSMTLIGGDPGIGKSTLVMQVAGALASKYKVLYISGEESADQVKLRLDRLNVSSRNIAFVNESDIHVIRATLLQEKPSIVIIDSIQTMIDSELPSEAGSVNQIRACAARLLECAKKHSIAVLLIGHVTKEGVLGGPKTLEHLVDTVVYMEMDRQHLYRILRTVKNRFGQTSEIGVFDMKNNGLFGAQNPSSIFLQEETQQIPGMVYSAVMEGSRIFLVEAQALVTKTAFGYPLRKSSGFDVNKLHLLVAVLGKRAGINLMQSDIHVNIIGGFKNDDRGADLAIALALASAFLGKVFSKKILAFGEVGLGGEVRSVPRIELRLEEASRHGFQEIIMPKASISKDSSARTRMVRNLKEAIELL